MTKTEKAEEQISKYIEISKKTGKQFSKTYIAGILYNENSDLFSSVEDARQIIRGILGLAGEHSRKVTKYNDLRQQFSFINDSYQELVNPEPYIYPKANDKILNINDVHSLFWDKGATLTALEYGKKRGANSVFINGDLMDFYGDSKFDKNPKTDAQFFINEREWGVEFLSLLQKEFGHVVYKLGNHDVRKELQIQRISARNPEIIDAYSLQEYLHYDMSSVNFVEDYRVVKIGKLNAVHGHEVGLTGGVNASRNMLLKTFDNVISGHSHITQSFPITDLDGNIYMSFKVGCLCQLKARYAPINQWNNGCAFIEVYENGEFTVDNKMIINNKIR